MQSEGINGNQQEEARMDVHSPECESSEVYRCQQTQTDPVPPSPTKTRLRNKIKCLQMRLNRRNKKINSMAELIKVLKDRKNLYSDLESVLESHFSGFPFYLLKNQLDNSKNTKHRNSYSDTVKQFALTLHFYSPKAYKYVRSLFILPHPNRLRSWISSVNCEPGFIGEVFQYLKENSCKVSHLRDCALIFDSMSIRSQLVWDEHRKVYSGYIDLGEIPSAEAEDLAKEALVFQIVSYTKRFKCPVAYFLVNKVSGDVFSEMIRMCLVKLCDVGVVVRSITCDGASTNVQALKKLGCQFSADNIISYFNHPSLDSKVNIMFDPCHMLQLARNTLADKIILKSLDGDVKWEYIEKLNSVQEKIGLKFANSISPCHVNYHNKKMNVSLAALTLSSGVADAIEFLDVSECVALLICNENSASDHTYCKTHHADPSSFTKKVSRGGLLCASESVYRIVQCTEKHFQALANVSDFSSPRSYYVFINAVYRHALVNFACDFSRHSLNTAIDCEDMHQTKLVKDIITMYATLRLRAISKTITLNVHGKCSTVRQKFNKLVTFLNV